MIRLKLSRWIVAGAGAAGLLLVCPDVADAHSVNQRFGDFYGGMLHPITAVEHLFPMLGLSLLAGQQGAARARTVLWLFPLGILCGTALSFIAGFPELLMWFNRLTFVAVGLLVAGAVKIPPAILYPVAWVLGLSHGLENTYDLPGSISMQMFLPGLLVCSLAAMAIGSASVVSCKLPWQQIAVRVLGSWIAAIGILVIGVM